MNAFSPALFSAGASCMPCCAPPMECGCYFPIPIGATNINPPYSSYANAAAAISSRVFDCLIYGNDDGYTVTTTPGTNSLAINGSQAIGASNNGLTLWMAVSLKAGSTIQFDWVATATGASSEQDSDILIQILKCDWSPFGTSLTDSDPSPSGFSGTLTGPVDKFGPTTIPSDDTYFLLLAFTAGYGSTTTSVAVDWTVTVDDTAAFQPVVALWDDSGTTRQLEACPKLYLPVLTESTGDWYEDCANAAANITLATADCLFSIDDGYGDPPEYTASGALVVARSNVVPFFGIGGWASFNAIAGETISVAWTDFMTATVDIYDDTGTLVQHLTGSSSPLTSSALPYTGRYIIHVVISAGGSFTSASFMMTSSGTITANPIQALYDIGLTCPARLYCGDSCP